MRLQTRNAYQVMFMYCLDCLKLRKRIFSLSSTEEYIVINMDHFGKWFHFTSFIPALNSLTK